MAQSGHLSAPAKLVLLWVLTIGLVYILDTFFDQYISLTGGLNANLTPVKMLPSYIIVGSLLTLMNIIVRPILNIIFFPFKLIFGLIGLIAANGLFLWLTEKIAERMDPQILILSFDHSIGSWIFLALFLGLANWVMKEIIR